MMQQLRDSTKIIMILVSISFVGLMVFEWGMDFSGRGPGGGSPTRLGSVNGAEISIDEYQRQYRLLYEQAQQRAPEGTLSAEQQSQLEEEAWEAVIDFALLRREVTRRDLTVTDTELIEFIRSKTSSISRLSKPTVSSTSRSINARSQTPRWRRPGPNTRPNSESICRCKNYKSKSSPE
jgi:hypothetical protein